MIRFSLFGLLALAINLLLFSLMSSMVRHSQVKLEQIDSVTWVDFVRPQPDNAAPETAERTPPPQPPEPSRPLPTPRLAMPSAPKQPALRLRAPEVDLELDLQSAGGPYIGALLQAAPAMPAVLSARDLTPLITRPPLHPARARARHIEGFVEVEFRVREDGGVEDIRIIEAKPSGVFERAAERAVRQWTFEPHRVDGKPVAVRARQRMDFKLRSR